MRNDGSTKKFFSAAAAYILGEKTGTKIKGAPERVEVTRDVLFRSRELYEALSTENATLNDIMRLVENKHSAAIRFHRSTGIEWIL